MALIPTRSIKNLKGRVQDADLRGEPIMASEANEAKALNPDQVRGFLLACNVIMQLEGYSLVGMMDEAAEAPAKKSSKKDKGEKSSKKDKKSKKSKGE